MEDFDKVFPDLLQKITHSGEKKLDGNKIKKIDQLIRQDNCSFFLFTHFIFNASATFSLSSKHCKSSYQQIMRHLEKKHAEVRFSTLLICDYLVRYKTQFYHLCFWRFLVKIKAVVL